MADIRTTLPPGRQFKAVTPGRHLSDYWDVAKVYYGDLLARVTHQSEDGRSVTWQVPGQVTQVAGQPPEAATIEQARAALEHANLRCDAALATMEGIIKNRRPSGGYYACAREEYERFRGLMPPLPGGAQGAEVHIPATQLRNVYAICRELRRNLDPAHLHAMQVFATSEGPRIVGWGVENADWQVFLPAPPAAPPAAAASAAIPVTPAPPLKRRRWWLWLLLLALLLVGIWAIWWFFFRATPLAYQAYDAALGTESFELVRFPDLYCTDEGPFACDGEGPFIAAATLPYTPYDAAFGGESFAVVAWAWGDVEGVDMFGEPEFVDRPLAYIPYDAAFGGEEALLEMPGAERPLPDNWRDPSANEPLADALEDYFRPEVFPGVIALAEGFRIETLTAPEAPAGPGGWRDIEPREQLFLRSYEADDGRWGLDLLLPPVALLPINARIDERRHFTVTGGEGDLIYRIRGGGNEYFYWIAAELDGPGRPDRDELRMEVLDARSRRPLPGWQQEPTTITLERPLPGGGVRQRYFLLYYISQHDIAQLPAGGIMVRLSNRFGQQIDVMHRILEPSNQP